jgi:hypothetical protein
VLAACGSSSSQTEDAAITGDTASDVAAPTMIELPAINAKVDYQLGGAYPPPADVTVVSRDRNATPASGLYNICYVNGFQIQPDEESFWLDQHPNLVLRDGNGAPVVDSDWNEMLIDIRTPEKRNEVAAIVGTWIAGCAQAGYNAVEIDNLDSYTRSQGLLGEADAIATMKAFSDAAHAAHLAIAQKNSAEIVANKNELGTDFAVAEECNRYSECDTYTAGYGDHVIVIEYRQQDFTAGCASFPNLSIVLRDVNLVTPASIAYVYDGC